MWTVIFVQIRGYGPKRVVFKDGKAYCTPWTYYGYKCFEEDNDSQVVKTIERLWGCHENKIQHWQNFYFEFDFNYNQLKKTFVFGDVEYGVMSCESNGMSLSSCGEDRRTVGYYEADLTDNEKDLIVFNNYTEITQYKLSQLREIYGNMFTEEYYNNLSPSQSWSKDYDLVELERKFNEEMAEGSRVQ